MCESPATISPRVPASQGLPLPVVAALALPADLWSMGANFAQDIRWAAVANRVMSTPSSATSSWAPITPDTGDLIELGHLGGERGDHDLDLRGERVDVGAQRVDAVEHAPGHQRVMVVEVPGQRLPEYIYLGSHARPGQLR